MGYESKLFIVEKSNKIFCEVIDGKGMFYSNLVSMFELSKVYAVSDRMRRYPETDSYFYGDSNERIVYDKYGERLKEIPLRDAIVILENAMLEENYRRYAPCLAMLNSLLEHSDEWNEIVVLHYGY